MRKCRRERPGSQMGAVHTDMNQPQTKATATGHSHRYKSATATVPADRQLPSGTIKQACCATKQAGRRVGGQAGRQAYHRCLVAAPSFSLPLCHPAVRVAAAQISACCSLQQLLRLPSIPPDPPLWPQLPLVFGRVAAARIAQQLLQQQGGRSDIAVLVGPCCRCSVLQPCTNNSSSPAHS